MPHPMLLSPVTTRMLERLSNGWMTRIQTDPSLFADESRLALHDMQLYHATGKLAEVREALRRNVDCIRILEKSGIGWGKERYIKLLNPDHVLPEEHSDEGPEGPEQTEQLQRDYEIKKHLINILKEWFPDETAMTSPAGIWGWLVQVLDRFGVRRAEEDVIVLQGMKELLNELRECPVPESMSLEQILLYIRDMLQEIRAGVQPLPKPGSLYISSLANGGISGRKYTFLLGMDEHSWSGSIRQNPMLLDDECIRIGNGLQTAAMIRRERLRQRDVRLGMMSGSVTFSFSSYDLVKGTTDSPAFQLLQIFRRVTAEPLTWL